MQTRMGNEAAEAPERIAGQIAANRDICAALARDCATRPLRLVVTCARGSSDHAATYGKYLIETTLGVPVASAAPSVGSLYGRPMALDGALFVIISQSGQSPDLVANAQWAKRNGAVVVALVNDETSPVARAADWLLGLHAGAETSVAATKSYLAALVGWVQLVAHLSGLPALGAALDRLPGVLAQAWQADWSPAVAPLAARDNLLVVGRGLSLAIAQEAALKFKETAGLHAEAFSGAELMHGPLALIRPGFPVLAFSPEDATRAGQAALATRLRAAGATLLVAETGPAAPGRLPLAAGIDPVLAPLALAQSFYRLVEAVALARGHDPDRPPHLRKVTETR